MSAFDSISKAGFSTVQAVMGDSALWVPSNGSAQQTAKVLFNNPDAPQTLGDVDKTEYQPYKYWFEYYEGQFPGLKTSVDAGNVETVTVKGISLDIKLVATKYDGKNYIAFGDENYTDPEGVGNDAVQMDMIVYEQEQ